MPWDVKKNGDQWCVYKKGASSPIKGGCHSSEAKAKKQLRALYASEAMSRSFHIVHVFSDQDKGKVKAGEPIWIHAAPYGETQHPVYGEVVLDDFKFDRFIDNFYNKVLGYDLPVRFEHFGMDSAKGMKAAGHVVDVKKEESGLWYKVAFTNEAADEINDGAWKYFSFEYDDLFETTDNNLFLDVLRGGALTNDPYWGNMTPLFFSTLVKEHPEILDESKEIEHSEPGSGLGGEPEPREQESDQNTERRHRIDTPPHILEEEGSMEELLKLMRNSLGLKEDADEKTVTEAFSKYVAEHSFSDVAKALGLGEDASSADVLAKVTEINAELEPLREADAAAEAQKSFAKMFPREWEEHQRLISESRENKAKAFANLYTRFAKKKTGENGEETVERSTIGFSARTLEEVAKAHLAFSNGSATEDHLRSVLDSIADVGLVDYGEKGSAIDDVREVPSDPRRAFAQRVKEVMEKDELSRADAVKFVAKDDPELYRAYRKPVHMATTPNS